MEDKMCRFLTSIGIENLDNFDLDFDMVSRDRFYREKINMVIKKASPWNYERLREFQEALNNATYPYSLLFVYSNKPSFNDVVNLFELWYQTNYRNINELSFSPCENKLGQIQITYHSEEEREKYREAIKDFKDLLRFINYEYVFVEVTKIDEPILLKEEETKAIIDAVSKESEGTTDTIDDLKEEANEDGTSNEENQSTIDEFYANREQMVVEFGEAVLQTMIENKKVMEKEREINRRYTRGNYKIINQISEIQSGMNNVDFSATIYKIETKDFKGKVSVTLGVSDGTGAIYVKYKQNNVITSSLISSLKKKMNVRVRGCVYFDEYLKEVVITGHFLDMLPPEEIAPDTAEVKRVELHLHSNMSNQDGITKMTDYCNYAKAKGHKALAITDHGVVQSFPDAQNAAKAAGLKMIYGCEFYLVNDQLTYIFNPSKVKLSGGTYVVLDLETTGLSSRYDKIIEFGAVRVEKGSVISSIDILINPERPLSKKITEITDITDVMLKDEPTIGEVLPRILDFCKDAILVTHNASFDYNFLQEALRSCGMPLLDNPVIDTLALSRHLFPENSYHNLGTLCRNMDIKYDEEEAHRADYDARVLNDVWQPMLERILKTEKVVLHEDLANLVTPKSAITHLRPIHCIALVKNKKGLRDLYELVSISHTKYFSYSAKVPFLPRKELSRLRENLLIGSACFNGEVFETARNYTAEHLKRVMEFYDYIEVQPLENYSYLVNMQELSEEEIKQYVNDIIDAASEINKPVVATGDVHYLTKKEKVFRDVYISSQAVGGVSHALNPYRRKRVPKFENPDQHYRDTNEMLECFNYLPKEKAYEIVVTNSNLIADMIEPFMPAPNDYLYKPSMENCEEHLRNFCYETCKSMYGDPIPKEIKDRLDRELNGIINHGYAVTYWIAHELVAQANKDGYIVGSRGSVGSSFAATMAKITEVNPLPAHYICPHCHKLIWGKDIHPEVMSGYDLPAMKCPDCGTLLDREGQNIPFETFLGFKADKVPDIDLNFPGDYQARAHNYTKVLFEEHHVFRAGTIGTVAEKTAYGFARGYFEKPIIDKLLSEDKLSKSEAEEKAKEIVDKQYSRAYLDYLASGCTDVRRTTGQHPGGIVVVPMDHEIYDFCPVQYPADDPNSEWLTTHFDFESIHDTLLKLDMLGHDDPMALKMMCELSHVDLYDIPLSDEKVLSLFTSPKALNMKSDYLGNKTGASALPEFGTENTRRILETTQPKTFTDLVVISGLSHGTGVWAGNAEDLIKSGQASLRNVIGCRDDIMTYLMSEGIEPATSFKIMETVRKKDKYLSEEQIQIMKSHNVPSYYIDSANKIEYLFPKGHAVAYCMMAVRVGYFKVYYPLEFYATFFSVRSTKFDIFTMIKGQEAIISKIDELKLKSHTKAGLSNTEDEIYKTLQIALEMIQRGYSFSNISLEKSEATKFVIDYDNKSLIPPFATLDGLGENNAESVIEARKERAFSSKEDLLKRTHLSTTNLEDLSKMGVLEKLPDSEQLSLFDF